MQPIPLKLSTHSVTIDNWQDFQREGEQFLRAATGGLKKRKKAFTPEIIYNVTAMAIEKYIMAYLMKNGDLADNHTMADLIRSLERHPGQLPSELASKLLYLDTFQEICNLDTYQRHLPSWEQAEIIVAIGQELQQYLLPLLAVKDRK